MKEIPSIHPDIVEHMSWLSQEMGGEDPRLTRKIEKVLELGVGRGIYKKFQDKPLNKKVVGLSLPLSDEAGGHMLAFTNGFIGRLEPDLTDKENRARHNSYFAPRNTPFEPEGAWETAADLSRIIRYYPGKFASVLTHSIFNPDQRHETEELFSEALENAFVLRENETDGLKRGAKFLNDALTIFEKPKDKNR